MQPYGRLSPNAGVTEFEIGMDYIKIRFTGDVYTYTYRSAGVEAVEDMKVLAQSGAGLSTYIAKNRPDYESKE